MGATRANTRGGGKEKNTSQKSTTQATTKSVTVSETPSSKKMQATPDQLRMAQMLSADTGSDKSVEIQAQVQQVIDVTGKSEEAILTALHDCNYNTEQAIIALLDTADDPNEWQTISSKKSKSQQNMQSSSKQIDSTTDLKDSRSEKRERGDRGDDFKEGKSQRDGRSNRGRGRVPPRMARGRGRENGASRERDNDDQSFGGDRGFSNDRDRGFSNDRRFNDRNESGRGRGRRFDHMNGGGSRRGGRGGSRSFTNSKFGTFEGDAFTGAKPGDNVWTNPPKTSDVRNSRCNASNFTASTWDSVPKSKPSATPPCNDDWGIDDWTGDLSKSQVFTPSTTEPATFKEDPSPPVYTPSMDSAVVSSTISAPGNQTFEHQSIDIATLLGKPPGSMSSPSPAVGESMQPPPRPQPDVFAQFAEMKPPSHTNKTIDQVVVPVQQVPVQQQRPAPVANQVKPARKKLPPPSKIPASAVEMPGSARGLGSLDVQFGVMDMDPSSGFSIGINIPSSSAVPSTAQPSSSLPVSGSMPPGITQKPGVFSVEDSSVSSSYAYPSQRTDTFSASNLPSSNTGKVHLPFGGFDQASMTEKTSQNKISTPVAIPLPNQNDLKANTYMSGQSQASMDTYSTSQQSQMSRSTTSTLSSSVLSSTSALHQSAAGYPQPHGSRTSQSSYGNTDQSSGPTGGLPNSRPSGKTDSYTGSVSTITGLGSNVMPSSAHGKGINPGSHNQGLSNTVPSGMNVSVPSSLTGGTGSSAFGSPSLSSSSANSKSAASVGGGNSLSGLTNSSQSTSHSGLGSSSLNTGLSGSSQITTSSVSTHTSVQTSPMSSSKIGLDSRLDSSSHPSRGTSGLVSQTSLASASSLGVSPATASTTSSSLGYMSTSASSLLSSTRTTQASTTKAAPNLPPGMPIIPNQYHLMHNPLLVNAYAPQYFNLDEMILQSRMPMFTQQTAALAAGRDASGLSNTAYSVTEASKFQRTDASSPVATIATQQQTQQQGQTNHHQTQAAQQQPSFINPTVPPGYSYGGFPFYPAGLAGPVPGLQYTPAAAMFPAMNNMIPQATRSQSGTTPHTGFQQHNTYGQHNSHTTFATGYDDLPGTQDFKTGYGGVSQTQSKNTGTAVVTSSSGPSDLTGSSYTNKTHTAFDSKSFHGTPPPFNIPLAGAGQGGHINPTPYAHTHSPFVPMMQQAHMLPHQMHGDGQGGSTQRSQTSATQGNKGTYGNKGSYGWGS